MQDMLLSVHGHASATTGGVFVTFAFGIACACFGRRWWSSGFYLRRCPWTVSLRVCLTRHGGCFGRTRSPRACTIGNPMGWVHSKHVDPPQGLASAVCGARASPDRLSLCPSRHVDSTPRAFAPILSGGVSSGRICSVAPIISEHQQLGSLLFCVSVFNKKSRLLSR